MCCSTISVSQTYTERADSSEEWYAVPYHTEKHCAEQESLWTSENGENEELQLPSRNEFIPHDFDLVERDLVHSPYPRIIRVCPS